MSERPHPLAAGASILLVDDEPTIRDTVRYNLVREGFVVTLAVDGLEAIRAVRADRFD
ncbi:MAG: DNA-binding response regulator, partial [Chloroflexia bacterium]|nr:DNA-binding response regulator [Chloroflexia bacterium]